MTKEEEKGLKVTRHGEDTEKTRKRESGPSSQGSQVVSDPPALSGALPDGEPTNPRPQMSSSEPPRNTTNLISGSPNKENKKRNPTPTNTTKDKEKTSPGTRILPATSARTTTTSSPAADTHSSSQNGYPEDQLTTAGQEPARQTNKCCLCWCCCCSCSCSALRSNQENRTKPKDPDSDLNCDPELTPSLDEIRSWGESFDKLMRNVAGRKVFREFLKCEYSEENILFWLACEELRKESKPELIEEKARVIYEDYISILSPKEVSLDSRVREVVNQNMVDPSPTTFDEAQVQIYTLMHRDSYPRFVNSIMYKKLAGLNLPHRGSSVSTGGLRSGTASRKESLAA